MSQPFLVVSVLFVTNQKKIGMKRMVICMCLASATWGLAQEKEKIKPEFGVSAYVFSGNAVLQQRAEVDQNSFIRDGVNVEFDVKWDGFGVYAGVGTYSLTTNRIFEGQSTYLKNEYLLIPFGLTSSYPLYKKGDETKLSLQLDVGGYAGHLYKSQEKTTDLTWKEKNVGWNFGFMARMGVSYMMYKNVEIKAGLQAMSDLSKINTQKVTKSTMYFIGVGYRF